jgi:metal-responsive CopG/Arc/MetJ family transcriptional regulator
MTTISCKLPESLAARLDAAARQQRRSKSALLREALETSLKSKKRPVTALDLVGHLRGSVPIDVPDLSTNPEYMRGFGE